MEKHRCQPPSWAKAALRFIIHPDFNEEIEDDILEKYRNDLLKYGYKNAQLNFWKNFFSLFRPGIIFNSNHFAMKRKQWVTFFIISIGIVVAGLLPFLPGPRNHISHTFSQFVQVIGYVGLVFVPFGLIWLMFEIRNKKGAKLNHWTSGYYPALLVLTPIIVFIPIQILRALRFGPFTFDFWPLIIIFLIFGFVFFRIRKLKYKTEQRFNSTPLFIVFLPLVAILCSETALPKAAKITREEVISKTAPVITALENYKIEHAVYPDRLEDLEGKYISAIPVFRKMGLHTYQYEKSGETFQLSFEQHYHWYATEVVAYQKYGHKISKADYENYPTKSPDWRVYLAD